MWGAVPTAEGVRYSTWAPDSPQVTIVIENPAGGREIPMALSEDGYHRALDRHGRAGDLYKFRLGNGRTYPDPASRSQAGDVHGPSVVVDASRYVWGDRDWQRPAFRDLVIYELHAGTFTAAGTFRAAIDKLDHLRTLGVNAIELMPIADFPGSRNWGYDGVLIYAPARAYGQPDDLRALVDAAHARGIAVILDVVYNHLGPDGNYVGQYARAFFSDHHVTPWGSAFNFDGQLSIGVRKFFADNPAFWMDDYHIDGFRLDATHAIVDESPRHIFSDIVDSIHERGGYAIAEDCRNEVRLITPSSDGGFNFDGVWSDDFHHIIRVTLTGEQAAFFRDYTGTSKEMVEALQHGWLYCGQQPPTGGKPRGTPAAHLPPAKFIHCISNHDQVGNRALGGRLHSCISADAYRALSALVCLTPYTPLLFMGQEWAASTPFLYFCDHKPELGILIQEGRRREFAEFPEFAAGADLEAIPNPQAEQTFQQSKLNWQELAERRHADVLELYRECLRLRHEIASLRPADRTGWQPGDFNFGPVAIRYASADELHLLITNLWTGHQGSLLDEPMARLGRGQEWQVLLSSEERRFGGSGDSAFDARTQCCSFAAPETLLLRAAPKNQTIDS